MARQLQSMTAATDSTRNMTAKAQEAAAVDLAVRSESDCEILELFARQSS
jgi:hypothetical protein